MSYAEDSPPSLKPRMSQEATALAYEWRKLTRAATAVAVLTSPAWFLVFWKANHWDWYWALLALLVALNLMLRLGGTKVELFDTFSALGDLFTSFLPTLLILGLQLPLLFFINFAILFGPLLFFGIKQMKAYEPGDADWGVK